MDTYGSTAEKFPLILPATNEQQRNLECRQLTEPPEFMTTVREMRARLVVLHSANSSHNTGADIDKSLLKRWRRDNTKIYGNQVVLKNYEKIAQLSDECYYLVCEIESRFLDGKLPKVTTSKKITQHTFHFLNGKTEKESCELLQKILNGETTATKLNYVPKGKAAQKRLQNHGESQDELLKVSNYPTETGISSC